MTTTTTTCSTACWQAKEPSCSCSCGSRNHGIAQRGGAAPRMKRDGEQRYVLVGTYPRTPPGGTSLAWAAYRDIKAEHRENPVARRINYSHPTARQQRWPEFQGMAWGLWVPVELVEVTA